MLTLETNLNRLFETNAKFDNIPNDPDVQIIFHDKPYISYPQITLDDNLLAYLNGILRSRSALRTGVILSPYLQSFEINVGTQFLKVNFRGLNKQIEWLEISLVFDKSNQHQTAYDSYDVKLAAKHVQLLALENASTTYSLTGQLEHNLHLPTKMTNTGYARCLLHITVMDVALHHLHSIKKTKLNKSLHKKKTIFGMILMKGYILIRDVTEAILMN